MQTKLKVLSIFSALSFSACGTTVDVGENPDRGRPQSNDPFMADAEANDQVILQPGSSSSSPGVVSGSTGSNDTGSTGSSGNSGSGSGSSYPLTCYGPNPQLTDDFQAFCKDLPDHLKLQFATGYELVCSEQRLVNLALFDQCAWTGDEVTVSKHKKILEMTDRTDTSLVDFYLLVAYALTSQSSPDEHVEIIRKEMTDPNYLDTYMQIKNSTVSDVTVVSENHYQYSVSLANSAATVSFRANLEIIPISPTMTAIFDYAYDDKVIIKEHKFARILIKTGDQNSRIIGLDEKLLEDGGNHDVAYTNLMDVLKQRMTKDYENSVRD